MDEALLDRCRCQVFSIAFVLKALVIISIIWHIGDGKYKAQDVFVIEAPYTQKMPEE